MHRGSTPTFTFEFNISLEGLTDLNIAFAQKGSIKLEKSLEDVKIDGNKLELCLTEDETLLFETDGLKNAYVDTQFKFGFADKFGSIDKRAISDITQIIIKPILKEGKLK